VRSDAQRWAVKQIALGHRVLESIGSDDEVQRWQHRLDQIELFQWLPGHADGITMAASID
jgi:hypothetical protein